MSALVFRLQIDPPPSGEDVERIEDLIASALWRHGWRGALNADATGNTVALKYAPADDGRGYPHAAPRADVPAGQREFTFDYRVGEISATVCADSSDAAWAKLNRFVNGHAEPGVTLAIGDAMLHTCFWEETTEEPDEDIADEDDGESWDAEPPDEIYERSDDWTGCASADSVEI